jgi:hypothetical protein
LQNGEVWRFVTRTRQQLSAQLAEPLPRPTDVERIYGKEAAERARPDRPTIQVRLIDNRVLG